MSQLERCFAVREPKPISCDRSRSIGQQERRRMRTTAPYNTIHSLFVIGHRSRPILHTQRAARHHNRLGYAAHQRLTNNSRLLLFGLGTHSCVESGLFLKSSLAGSTMNEMKWRKAEGGLLFLLRYNDVSNVGRTAAARRTAPTRTPPATGQVPSQPGHTGAAQNESSNGG